MIYRRLSSDHDYCFGRGLSDYLVDSVEHPDAISQAIKTRLLLLLGEWWMDTKDGLPLWQKILGTRIRNKGVIDGLLVTRIKGLTLPDGTKGIIGISNVVSSFDSTTREYSFSCVVDTSFGKLIVTNKNQGVTA